MEPELAEWLVSVRDDPLAFVMGAFPWGQPGTQLEAFDGPMPWAKALMERIRIGLPLNEAILEATASGHGIAKSTTVAQLMLWAFITFPDCRGVITANTETQLKTKTWAEAGKWFNLLSPIIRQHFELKATALLSKDPSRERTWRIDMIPWSKTNPQAFAGLHNKGNRLILVFDEASEIEDIIWETAEGAFSDADTQLIWLAFGNPTRNTGRFRECFEGGQHNQFWHTNQIDSREVPITNKKRIEQLIRVYGADSDYVRIRILGQFPRQGLMEFFLASDIDGAMSPDREVYIDAHTPLAVGVDVARYGANNSVIFSRKGRDARSIARKVFNGISTVTLADHVFDTWQTLRPDGIFIDGGGVGGGVVDNCRAKHLHVMEVQFGGKDDITGIVFDNAGEKYANKRASMYGALRSWVRTGLLPIDADLRTAMLAIRYTFNKKDEIILTPKEDILADNPGLVLDDLDALALTFGGPLTPHAHAGGEGPKKPLVETEWNPYSQENMDGPVQHIAPSYHWNPHSGQADWS